MNIKLITKRPVTITTTMFMLIMLTMSIMHMRVEAEPYKPLQHELLSYKVEGKNIVLFSTPQYVIKPTNPIFHIPKKVIVKPKIKILKKKTNVPMKLTTNLKITKAIIKPSLSRGSDYDSAYVPSNHMTSNVRNVDTMNHYCSNNVVVEMSYYSEFQSAGGFESLGSTGKYLETGDIAMPYAFPDYTQVVLKDLNGKYIRDYRGNIQVFTSNDRGSRDYVKEFNGNGNHGSKLRIDVFQKGVSTQELMNKGISYATMEVIRWGKNNVVKVLND